MGPIPITNAFSMENSPKVLFKGCNVDYCGKCQGAGPLGGHFHERDGVLRAECLHLAAGTAMLGAGGQKTRLGKSK